MLAGEHNSNWYSLVMLNYHNILNYVSPPLSFVILFVYYNVGIIFKNHPFLRRTSLFSFLSPTVLFGKWTDFFNFQTV